MQKLIFRNGNGKEINLTSGDYGITEWEGFSANELNIQSQQVPFQDGGVFLDALLEQRILSVTVAMNAKNDLEKRYRLRREMISTLNPKLGEGLLIYTNDFLSKQIHVIPQLPVFENNNSNDSGTPKVSCSFVACNPYWEDLEETVVKINNQLEKEIINNGDVPCPVNIDLYCTNITNPFIKNKTNNKIIKINDNVNNFITINTELGNKNIFKENLKKTECVNTGVRFWDMCYYPKENCYFCVGENNGSIFKTYNGNDWVEVNTGLKATGLVFYSIIYSEEKDLIICVGSNGKIITSVDGITWTTQTSGTNKNLQSVCYSDNLELFVIAGSEIILSSVDGITWTTQRNDANVFYNSVVYAKTREKFVVVGSGGTVLTSNDGRLWTSKTSGVSVELESVCYSDDLDLFVAVGQNTTVLTSKDSENWEFQRLSGRSYTLSSVHYYPGLGKFIITNLAAIAEEYNKRIYVSDDGKYWSNFQISNANVFTNSFYLKNIGELILFGGEGTIYKTNLNTYEKLFGFSNSNLNKISLIKDYYYICTNYDLVRTKDFKIFNWLYYSNINSICYSEEKALFVAVGDYGKIITSVDGESWQERSTAFNESFKDICYSKNLGLFFVVGTNGIILSSSNGITWSRKTSGVSSTLKSICYSEDKSIFVIYGTGGSLYSTDGNTWNLNGTWTGGRKVIYSEDKKLFISVGEDLNIAFSSNGIYWENANYQFGAGPFNDVCYSDDLGLFITVGAVTYVSFNGRNWIELEKLFYNGCCFGTDDIFIVVGSGGNIFKMKLLKIDSIISLLSSDSDMTFNLEEGSNKIFISSDDGLFSARLKYRQKYLGV